MELINNFAEQLATLKERASKKLVDIASMMLIAAKLITRSYSYEYWFRNREETVVSQYKLALLLAKEIRRRLPYLPSSFVLVDRRNIKIYVVRDRRVILRYVSACIRKLNETNSLRLGVTVEYDQTFTGYVASGKVCVITLTYMAAVSVNINPYKVFKYLGEILTFMCSLSKFSPYIIPLTEEQTTELGRIQATNRDLENRGERVVIPDNIPISTLPLYSTNRMVTRNERQHYHLSSN